MYRVLFSHKHLLEWTTSEEAEKQAKSNLVSYYNQMAVNVLIGLVSIGIGGLKGNIFAIFLGIFWCFIPGAMCFISKDRNRESAIQKLDKKESPGIL